MVEKFRCHWGLPNNFISWEQSRKKTIEEIQSLCRELSEDSHIYVYLPDTGNRICIYYVNKGVVNVDLQYSDPYCDGDVKVEFVTEILENYEEFDKFPEKYGLSFESD